MERETFLKRGISMGELIGFAITIISVGIMFYTSTQIRLNALEIRMDNAEGQSRTILQQLDRIEDKQDKIKEKINEVEIKVTNKKDK